MHGRTDRRLPVTRALTWAGVAAALVDPLTTWWSIRGGAAESNGFAAGLMRTWGLAPVLVIAVVWQVGVVAAFCWAIRFSGTLPDSARATLLRVAVLGFGLVVAGHWFVILSNVRVAASL